MPNQSVTRSAWIRHVLLLLVGAAPACLCCGCGEPEPESSQLSKPGATKTTEQQIERAIRSHVRSMDAVGPSAAARYAKSLARLKKHGDRVAKALMAKYQTLPQQRQDLRWKIVFTLGELAEPVAVPFLVAVADEKLVALDKPPSGGASPGLPAKILRKEMVLRRNAAVLALAKVAAVSKSGAAVRGLVSLLDSKNREVVIMAAIELHRLKRYPAAARAKLGAVNRIDSDRVLRTTGAKNSRPSSVHGEHGRESTTRSSQDRGTGSGSVRGGPR